MKCLEGLCRLLVKFSGAAGCLFLLINLADIALEIFTRQTSGLSLLWTEELARVTMVAFVLIGASAAFAEGDNMAIDFIVKALPPRLGALCRLLSFLIQVVVLGVLVVCGAQNVMGSWGVKTMALGIPRAVPLMAVPLGMGLLLAVLILSALRGREGSDV